METKYKIIIAIVSFLILVIAIYFIVKHLKAKRAQSLLDGNVVVANDGAGVGLPFDVGSKVSEINDALHGSWYDEDETKAVNAVLSTPKSVIPKLQKDYYTVTGYNLKDDLQSYLSSEQWLSIQSKFN